MEYRLYPIEFEPKGFKVDSVEKYNFLISVLFNATQEIHQDYPNSTIFVTYILEDS